MRSILMLSIGSSILSKSIGNSIDRHLKYADEWNGSIEMLVFAHKSENLSPKHHGDRLHIYPTQSPSKLTYPFDAFQKAKELIKDNDVSVIYTQDPFGTALVGSWLSKKFDIPLIIGNHSNFIDNSYWISGRPLFFRFLNYLAKQIIPRGDYWRVVNHREKSIYTTKLNLPADRIEVLPTPVSIEKFQTRVPETKIQKIRQNLGLAPSTKIILWVGRPVPVKRLPLLVQAFNHVQKQISDVHLLIIGPKSHAHENISNVISEFNLDETVTWLKEGVPHDELPAYYQLSSVFAFPSQYEGLPKAPLEAMASGLPVIATNTGGNQELIEQGENGFLVPVDNQSSLIDSLERILKDEDLREQMSDHAREFANNWPDHDDAIENIVGFWNQASHSNQTPEGS